MADTNEETQEAGGIGMHATSTNWQTAFRKKKLKKHSEEEKGGYRSKDKTTKLASILRPEFGSIGGS